MARNTSLSRLRKRTKPAEDALMNFGCGFMLLCAMAGVIGTSWPGLVSASVLNTVSNVATIGSAAMLLLLMILFDPTENESFLILSCLLALVVIVFLFLALQMDPSTPCGPFWDFPSPMTLALLALYFLSALCVGFASAGHGLYKAAMVVLVANAALLVVLMCQRGVQPWLLTCGNICMIAMVLLATVMIFVFHEDEEAQNDDE